MQYVKPYTFFFNKPSSGFTNLLLGCVCVLIPVVGQIVLLGYRAEMAEDLDHDPDLESYPDFDFNRFADYLKRGVWPFLTQLLVGAVLTGALLAVVGLGVLAGWAAKEPLVGLTVGVVLLLPLIPLTMLVLWPMELHTQLSGQFAFGQQVRFTGRFISKVWGQSLVVALAFWCIGMALVVVGYATCIGIYPIAVILGMAQQHFTAQLYRLYLDEGGTPIRSRIEREEWDNPDDEDDDSGPGGPARR